MHVGRRGSQRRRCRNFRSPVYVCTRKRGRIFKGLTSYEQDTAREIFICTVPSRGEYKRSARRCVCHSTRPVCLSYVHVQKLFWKFPAKLSPLRDRFFLRVNEYPFVSCRDGLCGNENLIISLFFSVENTEEIYLRERVENSVERDSKTTLKVIFPRENYSRLHYSRFRKLITNVCIMSSIRSIVARVFVRNTVFWEARRLDKSWTLQTIEKSEQFSFWRLIFRLHTSDGYYFSYR